MSEEENIAAYFQRVEEVVNTMKGLGETMEARLVVQKILRTLTSKYNPKVSAIEDREKLDDLKTEELQGFLTAYEMRIQEPRQSEATFKVAKNKHQCHESCSIDHEIPDEELVNFVNKLPRGTGRYKGKLPLKCFNCGKIGHFAAKCPLKRNKRGTNLQRKFKIADKQTLFTKTEEEGVSDFEEEEEEFFEGDRNEILFLAQENNKDQLELEEGVVDIEAELVATLEEIEKLKKDIQSKKGLQMLQ